MSHVEKVQISEQKSIYISDKYFKFLIYYNQIKYIQINIFSFYFFKISTI